MDDMTAGQVIATFLVVAIVVFFYRKRSNVKSLVSGRGWGGDGKDKQQH